MGTSICGLDRYVLPDKVWFLRVSISKYGIIFALVGALIHV